MGSFKIGLTDNEKRFLNSLEGKRMYRELFPDMSKSLRSYTRKALIDPPSEVIVWIDRVKKVKKMIKKVKKKLDKAKSV